MAIVPARSGTLARAGGVNTRQVASAPGRVARGGSPKTNPSGSTYQISSNRPNVEGTTSAWIRTLFDPAHARDYGCVGLPDENQTPTAVLSHRYDFIANARSLTTQSNYYGLYYLADGRWQAVSSSASVDASRTSFEAIYMFTHPSYGVGILMQGSFGVVTSSTNLTSTRLFGFLLDPVAFIENSWAGGPGTIRGLSTSITVSNVTAWSNIGGYFTGGNFPMNLDKEDASDILYLPKDIDQYATYTGEPGAGAYAISRPRNLDMIKTFKGLEDVKVAVYATPGASTPTITTDEILTGLYSIHPDWDWSFVCYHPCDTTSWTLRLTWFGNYEVTRPYSEGGTDGAVFDKAALELAISMCDNMTFCFPAEANDLGILIPVLKRLAHSAIGRITSGMGLPAGMAGQVQQLIDAYLNRKAAKKQLSHTFAVM